MRDVTPEANPLDRPPRPVGPDGPRRPQLRVTLPHGFRWPGETTLLPGRRDRDLTTADSNTLGEAH